MLLVSGSTRTVKRLAPHYTKSLGILVSPAAGNSITAVLATGLRWAADNGAFSGFDSAAFRRMLGRIRGRPGLLWVACPDRVADAEATRDLFAAWQPEIAGHGLPVAFVAQDGVTHSGVPWAEIDCLFIGGTDDFKLSFDAASLMTEAKCRDLWVHVGRVNSLARMTAVFDRGADSIDGGQFSMFGETYIEDYLKAIGQLKQQPVLFPEST